MPNRVLALVGLILVTFLVLPGCEQRRDDQQGSPLDGDRGEPEYVIAVVLDVSGSYLNRIKGPSPRAHQFFLKLTTRYRNDRGESDDRILISQISQTDTALLWEGTPRRLKKDFGSPEAFRNFLLEHSNPQGSRVHAGIARTIERLLEMPAVREGRARSCVFVCSDMWDNAPDGAAQKERLLEALRRYARLKHAAVGLYWVAQDKTAEWTAHLKGAGLKHFVCEPDQVSDPPLPRFD